VGLKPDYVTAHFNLGLVLLNQGDHPAAAPAFRAGLAIEPDVDRAHYNLGNALFSQWDLPGAAACFRRAIELNPGQAAAHCNLGPALLRQGDLDAALKAYRTGHDLGLQQEGWNYPSDRWIKLCEYFLELDARLPAVLKGEDRPSDPTQRILLGELCRYKRLHAASARFYTEAFRAGVKLPDDALDDHRGVVP